MDNKLNLLYDQKANVLYFSIGHPKFTDYIELDDNLILRLDPQTKAIVGFTVIDFAQNFTRGQTPLSVPLKATLARTRETRKPRILAEGRSTYRVKPATKVRRTKRT